MSSIIKDWFLDNDSNFLEKKDGFVMKLEELMLIKHQKMN